MVEDQSISKKLGEVEKRNNQYLAIQVESADRDRTTGLEAEPKIQSPQEMELGRPCQLETDDDHPDGVVSWIECAQDKRTWAEVQEDELEKGVTPVSFNRTGHTPSKDMLSCIVQSYGEERTFDQPSTHDAIIHSGLKE